MRAARATALVLAAAALVSPPAALADGDPASDVLLLRDVYLPYAPPPSRALAVTLEHELVGLRKAGYPMKVALIETRGDLGAYPDLYGKPATYAKLLEREILFEVKKPNLIVVMQGAGLAGRNLGAKGDAALAAIKVDAAKSSDGLAQAAIEAVAKVATANGHPTKVPESASSGSSSGTGGSSHTVVFIIAGLVVLAGIGLIALSVRKPRGA